MKSSCAIVGSRSMPSPGIRKNVHIASAANPKKPAQSLARPATRGLAGERNERVATKKFDRMVRLHCMLK
jgi:hypothetical protein